MSRERFRKVNHGLNQACRAARHELPSGVFDREKEKRMQGSRNRTEGKKAQRAEAALPVESKNQPGGMAKRGVEGAMTDIPLRKMASRQKGVIVRVDAQGELGRRIRDMGLVPGTTVEVQGRAPLKDPVAVRIRDCTLTLRNNEADQILIQLEDKWNE
jgi:ferrous iron transport protein A